MTASLVRDKSLSDVLSAFMTDRGQISGFRELLALADIASSDATPKGEKPLLFRDYICSSINCQFTTEDEVVLTDSTKLVVAGKVKKPEVESYTTELWSAANCRIIQHLIKINTTSAVLGQYAEYSAWVSDYLEIYYHRGVFLFDEQHRRRVADEGRAWNDIYVHDINRYLVCRTFSDKNQSKSVVQKSKVARKPNARRSRKVDPSGCNVCVINIKLL